MILCRYKDMLSVLLTEAAANSRNLYQFDPFHKVRVWCVCEP